MTILVGYTRTAEGQAALQRGVQAATSTGKQLAVFPLMDLGSLGPDPVEDSALSAALSGGATLLKRDEAGSHAAEDLLDTAVENNAALIVIGVRTRSRMSKMLLGSDAQSIILGSSVPVLTVKAESHEH